MADAALNGTGVPAPVVLGAAIACAACGLVYELALVAAGSAVAGDPVTETSLILSSMVFAMGAGSLATKPLRRRPDAAFAVLEGVLALVGGLCVVLVHGIGASTGLARLVLVALALVVGCLIGTEVPLLLAVAQRRGASDVPAAATDLLAADYVGALIGGLAFPFVLLPLLGSARAAVVAGVCNALAGAVVLAAGGAAPPRVRRWGPMALAVIVALLAGAFTLAGAGGRPAGGGAGHGCAAGRGR